jgi:hypothetical protein
MHCTACDRLLTEFESTRRNAHTFQFIDLCKVCFEDVKPFVPTIDRKDLISEADLDEIEDDTDTTVSLEADETLYVLYDNSREDYDDR